MSVTALMTQPVTVQPMLPGTADDYGNTPLAPSGAAVPEFGFLDQRTTTEFVNGRDTTVTHYTAFLHPDSVVTALATVTFGGEVFQVDGQPHAVYNPRTRMTSHIEAKLIEVT